MEVDCIVIKMLVMSKFMRQFICVVVSHHQYPDGWRHSATADGHMLRRNCRRLVKRVKTGRECASFISQPVNAQQVR